MRASGWWFLDGANLYRRSSLQMKGSRNLYFTHPGEGFALPIGSSRFFGDDKNGQQ